VGKPLVNDEDLAPNDPGLTVRLPDAGTGNQVPVTNGASLVVIYRNPDSGAPLRSIVIYDGGFTLDQQHDVMSQTIKGFYQASSSDPDARMTHIVGDGQSNFAERVLFRPGTVNDANESTIAGGPNISVFSGGADTVGR